MPIYNLNVNEQAVSVEAPAEMALLWVLRDGGELVVEARDLVPGDTMLLAAGDAVAAVHQPPVGPDPAHTRDRPFAKPERQIGIVTIGRRARAAGGLAAGALGDPEPAVRAHGDLPRAFEAGGQHGLTLNFLLSKK